MNKNLKKKPQKNKNLRTIEEQEIFPILYHADDPGSHCPVRSLERREGIRSEYWNFLYVVFRTWEWDMGIWQWVIAVSMKFLAGNWRANWRLFTFFFIIYSKYSLVFSTIFFGVLLTELFPKKIYWINTSWYIAQTERSAKGEGLNDVITFSQLRVRLRYQI